MSRASSAESGPAESNDQLRRAVDASALGLDFQLFDQRSEFERNDLVLPDDALVAATAVLVMDYGPDDAALAVRFLRSRYPFIQEVVVWNNANETMNHHMFPYDFSVRYIMAARNYSSFGRYLGCLVARHEICYFQHERARPDHLGALHTAFVARPNTVVTSAAVSSASAWKRALAFDEAERGKLMGYADLSGGTFAHKDEVRRFVAKVKMDGLEDGVAASKKAASYGGSSTAASVADADFAFSLENPPVVLGLEREPILDNRPSGPRHTPKELAASVHWAAAYRKTRRTLSTDDRHLKDDEPVYFRAPCADDSCIFTTSVDSWPPPTILDVKFTEMDVHAHIQAAEGGAINMAGSYHRAVDGDITTTWAPASGQLNDEGTFIGLDFTSQNKPIVGVELWLLVPAAVDLANVTKPRLELSNAPKPLFRAASECTTSMHESKDHPGLVQLVYRCPVIFVRRLRLVFAAEIPGQVAELRAMPLPIRAKPKPDADSSTPLDGTSAFDGADIAKSSDSLPARPTTVAYVIEDDLTVRHVAPTTLAFMEEACELGVMHPGRVTLIYAGPTENVTLEQIDEYFALIGSRRSLPECLKFANIHDDGDGALTLGRKSSASSLSSRRRDFRRWWQANQPSFSVVFFDIADTSLLHVLQEKSSISPDCIFSARVFDESAIEDGTLALADSVVFASKQLLFSADRHVCSRDGRQDRRVFYPLRTLGHLPEFLIEPTIPIVEEVLVLVTAATRAQELSMFQTNALPVLKAKATVTMVNLTAIAAAGMSADIDVPLDVAMQTSPWRTLFDLVYYVSIYPARLLWILDSSVGASFYASAASAQAARFVAVPTAVPHYERRLLAWNSTFKWSNEGFERKARELTNGEFLLSSGFKEDLIPPLIPGESAVGHLRRARLLNEPRSNDFIVEEWPIRREMHPFVNKATTMSRYVVELVSMSRHRNVASSASLLSTPDNSVA